MKIPLFVFSTGSGTQQANLNEGRLMDAFSQQPGHTHGGQRSKPQSWVREPLELILLEV